jgi:hypothetical protein
LNASAVQGSNSPAKEQNQPLIPPKAYLANLLTMQKKIRVLADCTLDMFFNISIIKYNNLHVLDDLIRHFEIFQDQRSY